MNKTRLKYAALIAAAIFLTAGCAAKASEPQPDAQTGLVTVTFDFQKQTGYASNQFAVWIENVDGAFVRTLYATRFTVENGYLKRPDAISRWVNRSGLSQMKDTDAITGATPKTGALSYTWDLTDSSGARVPNGTYRFFVEGTMRWKNSVLYFGKIEIGEQRALADAVAEYHFEASDSQAALTDGAPEINMIGQVSAQYTPPRKP